MSRDKSRINLLRALAVLAMAAGLSVSALAQSVPFPTYQVGAEPERVSGPGLPLNLYHPLGRQ